MRLICSVLLLAILEESYCKTTSSVNRTSTSWGYSYSLSDTRGFKVKHDDKGYQFEPFYNDTSPGLKKHYSSKSVYDQFTSPGATTDNQSHSSVNDVINGTTNSRFYGTVNSSLQGDKVTNKIRFDKSANGVITTVPATTTHTVTETRTEAPIATDKTSHEAPSSLHNIPVRGINGSPSVSSNGQFYKTTLEAPYGPQNTPMYAAPTGPLYYPQAPLYGQMYGPAGSSMYGLTNAQIYGPPMGPMYGPPTGNPYEPIGPNYGVPTRSMSGYALQNGQMYGPPSGQMYVSSVGPMYGHPTGNPYEPNGPNYGVPTRSLSGYALQNGKMYGPPSGQMYVPQNGQTNGYPTGSLHGSNRNY